MINRSGGKGEGKFIAISENEGRLGKNVYR